MSNICHHSLFAIDLILKIESGKLFYAPTTISQHFLDRGLLLTRKLLNQGFLLIKLKSLLQKLYGRHHDLVDRYGISVSQMTTDMFHLS